MKKLLLFLTLFITTGIYNQSVAQCTISDLKVNLKQVNTTTCEIVFDLSWTQDVNTGNKFAYLHMWNQSGYHTPAENWPGMYAGNQDYPVAADLVNALATIVIEKNGSALPEIGLVYNPDPSYILPQLTGLSVTKVHLTSAIERMTVQNIRLILPSCSGVQTIKFDAWASQAAHGDIVHCATQGASLVINEVKPVGSITCVVPRKFQVFIQNSGPAIDNVYYDVHIDYPPIGILNPTDTIVFESGPITLPANAYYIGPITGYLPYSERDPTTGLPLIIEVTLPARPNTTTALIENGCGTLPVIFSSFIVKQQQNFILVNWQTATEQNNRGFEVQRKLPGAEFITIAFVPSKAPDGNSNVLLNYSYADQDLIISDQVFYRIKQINLDGISIYSEVRFVRNNTGNFDLMLYPNPGKGMTNLVLPAGTGSANILLYDMSGREIKRWAVVADQQIQLNNLNPGNYVVRVFIKDNGIVLTRKLVIY